MTIETKFNYGDIAWYMKENKPISITLTELRVEFTYSGYSGEWKPGAKPGESKYNAYPQSEYYKESYQQKEWISAQLLFKTKEELLNSL
jgi:hypothetical protein